MKKLLLVILVFTGLTGSAQDVTGIWRGSFRGEQSKLMEMMGEEDRYKFEIQLAQTGKKFEGVTYSYKTTVFYGKASCEGTVDTKTKNILLDELKLLELKVTQGNSACVMSCRLHYTRLGDEEFMEGSYTSYNAVDSTNCGKGTIRLRKVVTSDFYKEPFVVENEKKKLKITPKAPATATAKPPVKANVNAPVKKPVTKPATKAVTKPLTAKAKKSDTADVQKKLLPKPVEADIAAPESVRKPMPIPKVIANRENELVKTILAGEGIISINIYDNGSVDNDTISVYLNNKLILSKKRLTEKALKLNFNLDDENDEQQLVMVAENLGEIPPNTSLMVVTAGEKKYEVRITSTEQKNAVIVFRLKK